MEILEKIVYIISTMIAIIGGILAIKQWYKSIKHKRVEIVRDCFEKIRCDEDILFVMRIIEKSEYEVKYEEPKFSVKKINDDSFNANDEIRFRNNIDKALSYFNYLCYLRKENIISESEIKMLDYKFKKIVDNSAVEAYLLNLYMVARKNKHSSSFDELVEYCIKRGYLNDLQN